MRTDNPIFHADNAFLSKEPRYVIEIDFDGTSKYLTSHSDIANVPGSPIEGVVEGISATSQTLNPDRANATIGSMSFNIVDTDEEFTDYIHLELSTNDVGLRGRTVRLYMGYKSKQDGALILDGSSTDDNPDFDTFIIFQTQVIRNADTKDGIYSVKCSDIQRNTKEQIFDLALTYLTASISATATTIPVLDLSGFEPNNHGTSYTDAPSSNVIYIRLDKTKEIIRCPFADIVGNSFTNVTRGVFGTTGQAIEVDPASASDRRPKVEEYVYLELPAVKLAHAILTGDIHGTADVLPSGWHAGVATAFVRLTDFTSIGDDLWDTTDDSKGIVLRFDGIEKQDAKKFLETEIYLLLGLFSPVYADGQLGLKRMVPSLSDSPYSFELNVTNVKSTGSLHHSMESVLNNLRIDWNWNGERFIRSTIIVDSASIARHLVADEKRLGFRGLVGTLFTEQVIRQLLTSLRDMYTGPPLRLDANCFLGLNQVEVGDACRVNLPTLRDFNQVGSGLVRTMAVHGMSVDWLLGVKLKLFGSSERADEIPPVAAATCLLDAFFTQEGTNLSSIGGLMSGNSTNAGTFNLVGDADMNAAGAVFYWDNDLTISSGTILQIEDNVQLRVKGFLTINGQIDGIARGHDPGATLFDSGQHYYWAADANVGVPGFIGNSRSHGGLLFRYPDEGGSPDWVWDTGGYFTEGLHQAFPNVVVAVSDSGSGSITGIPTDMRGGGGAHGPRAGEKTGLAGRTFQRADGGAGGIGGSGLAIVCRGGDFGVAGSIDLDGGDSVEAGSFFADPDGDYHIYGGAGGAGAPGTLMWMLDGSSQTFPDLAGHFSAKTGLVPAQFALPLVNGQGNQSLSDNNRPQKNMAPIHADTAISGFDQTGVNFRILYLPCDVTPEDDQAGIVSPPTGLATTATYTGVRLDWTNPAEDFVTVEVWMSDRNDRATATKIGESVIERWVEHFDDVERGAHYYWVRAVDADGVFSTYEPDTTPGVSGTPLRNRKNWVADPEFNIGDPSDNWTGSGNGSQTDFWRANVFPNDGTASAVHQPTEGEDGGVAIDLVSFGGAPSDASIQLENKKRTRFQTNKAVFQFVIKYKTVGSIDALDHLDFLTYIITTAQEFGGGESHFGGDRVTLPRSAAWTTVTLQQKVNSIGFNFIGWKIGLTDTLNSTQDILRIDSVLVYQVGGDEFGDNLQAGDVQAGLVPKALAAETAKYLKGDGTWDAPSGTGVDSFNTRTGAVVPLQADYDGFFLTPAEGDAAYAPIGTYVNTFSGRSGAVVPLQADYDGFFLTPAEGNAAYQAIGSVATFSGRSGAVVPIQADYDGFFLTPAEGNAAYAPIGTYVNTFAGRSGTVVPALGDYDAIAELFTVLQTFNGGANVGGVLNMLDNILRRALMDDFAIRHQVVSGVATTTINYQTGQSVLLNMTANITTFSITNWPATLRLGQLQVEIAQDNPARTINWPAAIEWLTGPPDISTVSERYVVNLSTRDGGTVIVGSYVADSTSGVSSVFGRVGTVVAVQADYDGFFLTPAEGNAAYAALSHNHSAADITSGILAVLRGGTGVAASTGSGNNVLSASPTITGTMIAAIIAMADNRLERAYLDDYAVLHQNVTATATTTINYSSGQSCRLTLAGVNITTFSVSNWPATNRKGVVEIELKQGSTPRTIAWPAAINWPDGIAPDITDASGRYLIYLTTTNAGTDIDGTYTPVLS